MTGELLRNVQYILGPCDMTYKEITPVLGKAINKPDLKYIELSYADAKRSLHV